MKDYRNLSEVRFVRRTIAEVKGLLCRMLEHDWCYSELEY